MRSSAGMIELRCEQDRYTKEAYALQKWGYIPDIVRLDVLYELGGFYFDTDVRILKNLDDLRYQQAFCGRERAGHVNFGGGSGSIPHSAVVKKSWNSARMNRLRSGMDAIMRRQAAIMRPLH
mgnify:CR=1 FL=1